MRVLLFGDSITDMERNRQVEVGDYRSYGIGYARDVASELISRDPQNNVVINRGISGNRVVDLYARVKEDVWNHKPDFISILIGINDIWHELMFGSGIDIDRYEKVYRMLIEETLKKLPDVKIMLIEPFFLEGVETGGEAYEKFAQCKEYAKVVKKLASEYNLSFLPLQESFDKAAEGRDTSLYLFDGVHPTIAGARIIADKWIKLFDEINERNPV